MDEPRVAQHTRRPRRMCWLFLGPCAEARSRRLAASCLSVTRKRPYKSGRSCNREGFLVGLRKDSRTSSTGWLCSDVLDTKWWSSTSRSVADDWRSAQVSCRAMRACLLDTGIRSRQARISERVSTGWKKPRRGVKYLFCCVASQEGLLDSPRCWRPGRLRGIPLESNPPLLSIEPE